MKLIGLTGLRGVGKSTAANIFAGLGYFPAHSFAGGKAAVFAYFRHIGASEPEAYAMVFGNLRDVPSALLPDQQTPRYLMERFGEFLGRQMGPEWTLGAELDRIERQRVYTGVIVESVVYEASVIRGRGGAIYRVVRDVAGPAGLNSDAAQAAIEVDGVIENNGSIEELRQKVTRLVTGQVP